MLKNRLYLLLFLLALVLAIVVVVNLGKPMTISSYSDSELYREAEQWAGSWEDVNSRELTTPEGNVVTLDFQLDQFSIYEPPGHNPSIEPDEAQTLLEQADILQVRVFHRHQDSAQYAHTGIIAWKKMTQDSSWLEVRIDTGAEMLRVAIHDEPEHFSLDDREHVEAVKEQRREFIAAAKARWFPIGLYPPLSSYSLSGLWQNVTDRLPLPFSPLWMAIPLYGFLICRRIVVYFKSGDRLLFIRKLEGDREELNKEHISIPEHDYTSPPLSELLQGENIPAGRFALEAYIREQNSVKEARTGHLVWYRSCKVKGQLVLVIEEEGRRFSVQAKPEIFSRKDADYDIEEDIIKQAAKRRLRLIPRALSW